MFNVIVISFTTYDHLPSTLRRTYHSQAACKCDSASRLVKAKSIGLGINDVMLEVGPARLTVSDLWTLILP